MAQYTCCYWNAMDWKRKQKQNEIETAKRKEIYDSLFFFWNFFSSSHRFQLIIEQLFASFNALYSAYVMYRFLHTAVLIIHVCYSKRTLAIVQQIFWWWVRYTFETARTWGRKMGYNWWIFSFTQRTKLSSFRPHMHSSDVMDVRLFLKICCNVLLYCCSFLYILALFSSLIGDRCIYAIFYEVMHRINVMSVTCIFNKQTNKKSSSGLEAPNWRSSSKCQRAIHTWERVVADENLKIQFSPISKQFWLQKFYRMHFVSPQPPACCYPQVALK